MKYKKGISERIRIHYSLECEFCGSQESSDLFEKKPDFYKRIDKDGWRVIDSGLEELLSCPDCLEKII